jgi:hypothetical protein
VKELDPLVFVAVLQEMLGGLFWPLVAFIVLGALALVLVLIRERGLDSIRLVRAELVGFFGGFVAIGLMLWVTASRPEDLLGGPIDWLLTVAIWAAGTVGSTIAVYVALSLLNLRHGARAAPFPRAVLKNETPRSLEAAE